MKVLVIDPGEMLWGSERVLLDAIPALLDQGLDLVFCTPSDSSFSNELISLNTTSKLVEAPIGGLHLKSKISRLFSIFSISLIIFKYKPNLIYINQAGMTKIVSFANIFFRIPLVAHVRIIEDINYLNKNIYYLNNLVSIVTVSKSMLNYFKNSLCEYNFKISFLYDPYIPRNKNINYEKKILSTKYKIVCVGRLGFGKGQDLLVNALSILRSHGWDVSLIFLGSPGPGDDFDSRLTSLADTLNITSFITFEGFVNDPSEYMNGSTMLVCPSRYEPLGRIVFEAWDFGLIVVAGKHSGGPAEVLQNSLGGVLFDESTPDSLALGIEKVLRMSLEERNIYVARGRKWLNDNTNASLYASNLISIFDLALKQKN